MAEDELTRRWRELVGLVQDEFIQSGMDPINFEPDAARLKLRAQLTFGVDSPEWHVQTLTKQDVLTGDLRLIAAEFYRDYRRDLDHRRGRPGR